MTQTYGKLNHRNWDFALPIYQLLERLTIGPAVYFAIWYASPMNTLGEGSQEWFIRKTYCVLPCAVAGVVMITSGILFFCFPPRTIELPRKDLLNKWI